MDGSFLVPAPKISRRYWTTGEERALRTLYPTGGSAAVKAAVPGRTLRSIYNRARALGLVAPGQPAIRQRWSSSPQIDEAIRRVYQGTPSDGAIDHLAMSCARPRWWVSRRAAALGFVAPRFKDPEWTPAELEIVEAMAHRSSISIVRALARKGYRRTATAITVKLKRLGTDRTDPDHYTATTLAGMMGVDATTVSGWIEKGWLAAKRRGTARTPVQGGDMWWISRRAVRRFVVENTARVDLRKVEKFWFVDLLTDRDAA